MNMSLFQIVQLGRKYLKLWPDKNELLQYFSEYRQIAISRFVCRYSVHFAVLIIALPFVANAGHMLSQALACGMFVLSMPIQVFIMLGLQADKHLPPALASWYKEGVARVNEQGGKLALSVNKPRYLDLVNLLSLTYGSSKK